jgi:hypothetical protein
MSPPVYTNIHNLPDYQRLWLEHDEYDYVEGVVSATGLASSVRQTILKERHFNDMEIDVTDMIARVVGTAIHASFENVNMPRIEQEQRVVYCFDKRCPECGSENITKAKYANDMFCEDCAFTFAARMVSGKYDMLKQLVADRYLIIDIKTTGVYNYIYKNHVTEWQLQLSTYKFILENDGWYIENGEWFDRKAIKVDSTAEICLVFTDWKREEALNRDDYPNIRLANMDVKLFGNDFIKDYIKDKIMTLEEARFIKDDNKLPFCTEEELWKDKDKYGVWKHEGKRASWTFKTIEEAEQKADERGAQYSVKVEKGMVKHCPFCDCRSVCNQYQLLLADGMIKQFEE